MGKWDSPSGVLADLYNQFKTNDAFMRRWNMKDQLERVLNNPAERGRTASFPVGMPAVMLNAFPNIYQEWLPLRLWSTAKASYTPHAGLSNELVLSHTNDKLSTSVMRQLPHPNPLFIFGDGFEVTHVDGRRGRLTAFCVNGSVTFEGNRYGASTHGDERLDGLGLTAFSEVYDDAGACIDVDSCHITVPFRDVCTLDELIDFTMEKFFVEATSYPSISMELVIDYVRTLVSIALPHILYVVSRSADIDVPRRATPAKASKPGRTSRMPTLKLLPVGYRIGARLDAWRRTQRSPSRNRGTGVGGWEHEPHMRRAHFQTFRYGPGKQDSYLTFLPPIPVKMGGSSARTPVIHEYR